MDRRKQANPKRQGILGHSERKAFLLSALRRANARRARKMPAHGISHQLNVARNARWYLEKISASQKQMNLGELGAIGHDLVRTGKGHGLASAKRTGEMLRDRVGKRTRDRITGAMALHGVPAVKGGKRKLSDPVKDAVFFGDRLDENGAWGVFRICAANAELPDRARRFRQMAAVMQERGIPRQEAEREAKIWLILKDARDGIRYGENPGFYNDRKPIDTMPAEEYYPKEVLPTLEKYMAETKVFIAALEERSPWAIEIVEKFFAHGLEGKADMDVLVKNFRPKTRGAKAYKQKALEYLAGKY